PVRHRPGCVAIPDGRFLHSDGAANRGMDGTLDSRTRGEHGSGACLRAAHAAEQHSCAGRMPEHTMLRSTEMKVLRRAAFYSSRSGLDFTSSTPGAGVGGILNPGSTNTRTNLPSLGLPGSCSLVTVGYRIRARSGYLHV